MNEIETTQKSPVAANSFFDRPQVQIEEVPIGRGVPLGMERVSNPQVGIGGVYGTWGQVYDNAALPNLIEDRLGSPLADEMKMNLSELGFVCRHHLPQLSDEEHIELEVKVGARFLVEAAHASGWEPSEVQAVLIGLTGPAANDYTVRIAREAGVPDSALKVSIHKACDGSVAGLHLALNPKLPITRCLALNLAEELSGKKVLVGGIEGLSRLLRSSHDPHALQLFGNGAGIIGVIPGQTMKFLVGGTHEVYDEEGLLAVRMLYPHSRARVEGQSMIETTQAGENHIRVAGLMHEPADESVPVEMAGLMGMVKLFVRNGVLVVRNVYQAYQKRMVELGTPGKEIAVAIVHHANLKINQLKEKHLRKEGICIPMPWLLNEFGNVSAASNMIAFLRKLSNLKPGDHVLFDGFGAGTYYDVFAVELGGSV
jgi:3-oxoacyl-[acyl-carrier-protein] synthase III